MNTSIQNIQPSAAGGIHRGVWIGGGLMALTIIALATTLVVKDKEAQPQVASGTPDIAASSVAYSTGQSATGTVGASPSLVAANPPAINESTRPVRHASTTSHHEAIRHEEGRNVVTRSEPVVEAAARQVAAAPVCQTCGVIESYSAVQVQGQNNGVGAVAGGLGGALLGSKIAGRNNHTLGGVVGAIGGGLLGNAIESHERAITEYDVRVRMDDGSIRTVRQANVPLVGQHVSVEGHTLRSIGNQG